MANVSEKAQWEDGIYQIEKGDRIIGGEDGVMNVPAKQLANRTQYLKEQTSELDERLVQLEGEEHIYGIDLNESSGTVTLLAGRVGKKFAAHKGAYDATLINDFDNIYPWSQIRACKVSNAGEVTSYKGDANYAADPNDYCIEIPIFWFKDGKYEAGGVEHRFMEIADQKVTGFRVHPIFIREDGTIRNTAYMGRMHCCYENNKLRTLPDKAVKVSTSLETFRQYAAAKNTEGTARWYMFDKRWQHALDLLMHIEIGGFDEQTSIGAGVSKSDNTTGKSVTSALVDALFMGEHPHSGYIGDAEISNVCYRGIWDLWGNYWKWCDGFMRNNGRYYCCFKPSQYANANSSAIGTGWTDMDYGSYFSGNDYQKARYVYDDGTHVISAPKALGASATTYYAAYLSNFAGSCAGIRALLVGGWWSNAGSCSLVYEDGGNTPADSYVNIGAFQILEN